MFYEYIPRSNKKKEKLWVLSLTVIAACLFTVSYIPGVLFPALLQLAAVICLCATVFLACRYLLRSFVYRIEENQNPLVDSSLDFLILEHRGKAVQTICRISLSEIKKTEAVTKENQKQIAQLLKGKAVYDYTAQLDLCDQWLLWVEREEGSFYLKITANEEFVHRLSES